MVFLEFIFKKFQLGSFGYNVLAGSAGFPSFGDSRETDLIEGGIK